MIKGYSNRLSKFSINGNKKKNLQILGENLCLINTLNNKTALIFSSSKGLNILRIVFCLTAKEIIWQLFLTIISINRSR